MIERNLWLKFVNFAVRENLKSVRCVTKQSTPHEVTGSTVVLWLTKV